MYVVIDRIHFFDKSLNFVCKNSKLKNEFTSSVSPTMFMSCVCINNISFVKWSVLLLETQLNCIAE